MSLGLKSWKGAGDDRAAAAEDGLSAPCSIEPEDLHKSIRYKPWQGIGLIGTYTGRKGG